MRLNRLLIAALAIAPIAAVAQPANALQRGPVPITDGYGTMNFQTKLGSFRLIDGEGKVDFTFKGTVMVSKLNDAEGFGSDVLFTGNVKKEYEGMDRVIYHGEGRCVVVGKWRAVQWFGSNMKGFWYGKGMARFVGEFDRDLNTGQFWYEDPEKRFNWFATGVYDAPLPDFRPGVSNASKAKRRTKKSGGG